MPQSTAMNIPLRTGSSAIRTFNRHASGVRGAGQATDEAGEVARPAAPIGRKCAPVAKCHPIGALGQRLNALQAPPHRRL